MPKRGTRWLSTLLYIALGWSFPQCAASQEDYVEALSRAIPEEYFTRWSAEVKPVATSQERAAFARLADPARRMLFRERFWAERDPSSGRSLNPVRLEHRFRRRLTYEHVPDPRDQRWQLLYSLGLPDKIVLGQPCPGDHGYERSVYQPLLPADVTQCVPPPPIALYRWRPSDAVPNGLSRLFYSSLTFGDLGFSCFPWPPDPKAQPAERKAAMDLQRSLTLMELAHCDVHYPELWEALRHAGGLTSESELARSLSEVTTGGFSPQPAEADWTDEFLSATDDADAPLAQLRLGYVAQLLTSTVPKRSEASSTGAGRTDAAITAPPELAVDGAIWLERDASQEGPGGGDDGLKMLRVELSWFYRGAEGLVPTGRASLTSAATPIVGGMAVRWSSSARRGDNVLVVVVHDADGALAAYGAFDVPLPPERRVSPQLSAELTVLPEVRIEERAVGFQMSGRHEIPALSRGPVAAVRFDLDGEPVATDMEPPFSAAIDFGPVPLERRLRVIGLDSEGRQVATDERLVNAGLQRFSVDLLVDDQPTYAQARVRVVPPFGARIRKVEVFRGTGHGTAETLVGSFVDPPYELVVPESETVGEYLRGEVTLDDGRRREDVRMLGEQIADRLEVEAVELFATITDRRHRFLSGLRAEDLVVRENGMVQKIDELSQSTESALGIVFLVDLSGSMEKQLDLLRRAVADSAERLLREGDRAGVLAFRRQVDVVVPLTGDVERIRRAGSYGNLFGRTMLRDALYAGLRYLDGLEGQKALVVLSDGIDTGSQLPESAVVAYAQSAGIGIYALGLGLSRKDAVPSTGAPIGGAREMRSRVAHSLERYTTLTGGLPFYIRSAEEVEPALEAIERDLRSQYRIVYHSSNQGDGLRTIEVELAGGKRGKVRTRTGYYP